MSFLKQGSRCQNCFHLWHRCKESRHDGCADFRDRRQEIDRQIQCLEDAKAHTLYGAMTLLILMTSSLLLVFR